MSCPTCVIKDCPCVKTDCANHGKCCACVANHRYNEKNPLPCCLRPESRKK